MLAISSQPTQTIDWIKERLNRSITVYFSGANIMKFKFTRQYQQASKQSLDGIKICLMADIIAMLANTRKIK